MVTPKQKRVSLVVRDWGNSFTCYEPDAEPNAEPNIGYITGGSPDEALGYYVREVLENMGKLPIMIESIVRLDQDGNPKD